MLKTLKMVLTGSLHGAQQERDSVKKSRQVCLLCPCERHLTVSSIFIYHMKMEESHLSTTDRW